MGPGLLEKYVKSGRFLNILSRDERVLSILNAHLLCEEVLRDYLRRVAAHPDVLAGARLSFSHVLVLARALCSRTEPHAWEWVAVHKLNKLRNSIAHEFSLGDSKDRIAEYAKFVWAHDSRLVTTAEKLGQPGDIDEAIDSDAATVAGLLDLTSTGVLLALCTLLDDGRLSDLGESMGVPMHI